LDWWIVGQLWLVKNCGSGVPIVRWTFRNISDTCNEISWDIRHTGCFKKSFTTLKAYRNLYRERVTCIEGCTYISVSLYMTTLIENIMWYSQYMGWTTLNVSTISDTAYCFHTFISSYKASYIFYYFTIDIINTMKCPTDEWLTTSTFF